MSFWKVLISIFISGAFVAPSFAMAGTLTQPPLSSTIAGYWAFNENSGSTLTDSSGNGRNGTIYGSPTWTTGISSYGIDFDATDDYVDIGDHSAFSATDGAGNDSPFSVSFWVNPNTGSGDFMLISKRDEQETNGAEWWIGHGDTYINYSIGASTNSGTRIGRLGPALDREVWTHVLCTYDGSESANGFRIYFNGVRVDDTTDTGGSYTGTINSNAPVRIGAWRGGAGGPTGLYSGRMDEVRIYRRVVTEGEATRIFNASAGKFNMTPKIVPDGLVGWWTFDGGDMSNGVALDRGGNARNAQLNNIATSTFYRLGKAGQAFNFDGSNDFASTTANTALNGATQLTIAGWVKKNSLTSRGAIFTRWTSASNWLSIQLATTNDFNFIVGNGGTTYGTLESPADTAWHHYALVYDGSQATNATKLIAYVDGVATTLSFTGTIPTTAPTMTNSDRLGYDTHNSLSLDGVLDDVRLYNRALTPTEIRALAGAGGLKAGVSSATQLVRDYLEAHWTFDGKYVGTGALRDASGRGRHGAPSGIATSTFYALGKVGQGAVFDGVDDYVDFGTGFANFQQTTPFSGSAWVKTTAAEQVVIMAKFARGTTAGWQFSLSNLPAGKPELILADASITNFRMASAANAVNDGTWHHVAFTYDGSSSASGITIYIDGEEAGTVVVNNTDPGALADSALRLGQRAGTLLGYFSGGLDDIRIYSRELSATEIQALYRATR